MVLIRVSPGRGRLEVPTAADDLEGYKAYLVLNVAFVLEAVRSIPLLRRDAGHIPSSSMLEKGSRCI